MSREFIHSNIGVNTDGHLTFAGVDTVEVAREYGTPCMLLDVHRIRSRIRKYRNAMEKYFPLGSLPFYASKALSFCELARIIASEGIGIDCVSPGEIETALRGGISPSMIAYHSNNKTDEEIETAILKGIGCFVVDGFDELFAINEIAARHARRQKVMLRITPGIDPHTHKAISTGNIDSKFGFAVQTGQAFEGVRCALELEAIELEGFHCHIGSQIFDALPFCDAADKMMEFTAEIRARLGYFPKQLDLGGGFAVRYIDTDREIDIERNISLIAAHIIERAKAHGIEREMLPSIILEPGRSIVADAGMTLYTVGSVKEIDGFRNYVSVNGGMTDNPRYALYQSAYTMYIANKADVCADYECTVAGRCCESGDLLGEHIMLARPQRNDILAVAVTGAYNYSMASNYNRVARPPIIIVNEGKMRIGVRRESNEDILKLDI